MHETLFTIGHSNHPQEQLIDLLRMHRVDAVCDVRSSPYSRINPQFNREVLRQALREAKIAYVFLGDELGARSDDPSCYEAGKVKYDRLARTSDFRRGLERVLEGAQRFRVALMCAEKEPLECHRTILVARYLVGEGAEVQHIHADGALESQLDALQRLMRNFQMPDNDMFRSQAELLAEAYERQEERIAFSLDRNVADQSLSDSLVL